MPGLWLKKNRPAHIHDFLWINVSKTATFKHIKPLSAQVAAPCDPLGKLIAHPQTSMCSVANKIFKPSGDITVAFFL